VLPSSRVIDSSSSSSSKQDIDPPRFDSSSSFSSFSSFSFSFSSSSSSSSSSSKQDIDMAKVGAPPPLGYSVIRESAGLAGARKANRPRHLVTAAELRRLICCNDPCVGRGLHLSGETWARLQAKPRPVVFRYLWLCVLARAARGAARRRRS
jgi:hypothetical protein